MPTTRANSSEWHERCCRGLYARANVIKALAFGSPALARQTFDLASCYESCGVFILALLLVYVLVTSYSRCKATFGCYLMTVDLYLRSVARVLGEAIVPPIALVPVAYVPKPKPLASSSAVVHGGFGRIYLPVLALAIFTLPVTHTYTTAGPSGGASLDRGQDLAIDSTVLPDATAVNASTASNAATRGISLFPKTETRPTLDHGAGYDVRHARCRTVGHCPLWVKNVTDITGEEYEYDEDPTEEKDEDDPTDEEFEFENEDLHPRAAFDPEGALDEALVADAAGTRTPSLHSFCKMYSAKVFHDARQDAFARPVACLHNCPDNCKEMSAAQLRGLAEQIQAPLLVKTWIARSADALSEHPETLATVALGLGGDGSSRLYISKGVSEKAEPKERETIPNYPVSNTVWLHAFLPTTNASRDAHESVSLEWSPSEPRKVVLRHYGTPLNMTHVDMVRLWGDGRAHDDVLSSLTTAAESGAFHTMQLVSRTTAYDPQDESPPSMLRPSKLGIGTVDNQLSVLMNSAVTSDMHGRLRKVAASTLALAGLSTPRTQRYVGSVAQLGLDAHGRLIVAAYYHMPSSSQQAVLCEDQDTRHTSVSNRTSLTASSTRPDAFVHACGGAARHGLARGGDAAGRATVNLNGDLSLKSIAGVVDWMRRQIQSADMEKCYGNPNCPEGKRVCHGDAGTAILTLGIKPLVEAIKGMKVCVQNENSDSICRRHNWDAAIGILDIMVKAVLAVVTKGASVAASVASVLERFRATRAAVNALKSSSMRHYFSNNKLTIAGKRALTNMVNNGKLQRLGSSLGNFGHLSTFEAEISSSVSQALHVRSMPLDDVPDLHTLLPQKYHWIADKVINKFGPANSNAVRTITRAFALDVMYNSIGAADSHTLPVVVVAAAEPTGIWGVSQHYDFDNCAQTDSPPDVENQRPGYRPTFRIRWMKRFATVVTHETGYLTCNCYQEKYCYHHNNAQKCPWTVMASVPTPQRGVPGLCLAVHGSNDVVADECTENDHEQTFLFFREGERLDQIQIMGGRGVPFQIRLAKQDRGGNNQCIYQEGRLKVGTCSTSDNKYQWSFDGFHLLNRARSTTDVVSADVSREQMYNNYQRGSRIPLDMMYVGDDKTFTEKQHLWSPELVENDLSFPVLSGVKVHIQNMYGTANYLDTCRSARCVRGTYRQVSTNTNKDRGGYKTGTWMIQKIAANDEIIRHNDEVYLRNMYGTANYLDVCNTASCTSGTKYQVSTNTDKDRSYRGRRGHKTATWKIIRAAGDGVVEFGDTVYLQSAFINGVSYLETCGRASCTTGTYRRVVTNTNRDRGGHKTGTWIFLPAAP